MRDFESLLHGDTSVAISKIKITSYHSGVRHQVILQNRDDVDFLSAAFRHSSTNDRGSFIAFSARIWFNDGNAIDVLLSLADDASCMAVCRDTSFRRDQVDYRITLERPLPRGIAESLALVLRNEPTRP